MKWIMLFLAVSVNILAGAAVYRVWVPPETTTTIDPIYLGMFKLHKDHVELERQHLRLLEQLVQCKRRAI